MSRYTRFLTLDGWHEVDANTDVTIAATGRQVPADSAPRGELVLIPPFATRGVRPIRVQRSARVHTFSQRVS